MTRRVAIPVSKGRLSEQFGRCNHYQLFDIDGKQVRSHLLEVPPRHNAERLPHWASSLGITDVVTHRLDPRTIPLFSSLKINLFVGIDIDTPKSIIDRYLNGTLTSDSGKLKN